MTENPPWLRTRGDLPSSPIISHHLPSSELACLRQVGTGFKDAERNWLGARKRWPVGTVVTYKYQNLTAKGVPRFPVFLRTRTDKTWEQVVADTLKDLDDREFGLAAGGPSVRRQPSLMTSALAPKRAASGEAKAAAAAAAAAAGGSGAQASVEPADPAPPVPVRRMSSLNLPAPLRPKRAASGSLLFSDDPQIGHAEDIAEAIAAREERDEAAPLGKRAKSTGLEPAAPGTRAVWSWRAGGGWTAYSDSECELLETAREAAAGGKGGKGQGGASGGVSVSLPSGYVVDLGQMAQFKPSAPSKKRGVRREVKDVVTRKMTRQLSDGIVARDEMSDE